MPIVAYSDLPSYGRLREEGQEILSRERAETQDIRTIHIGILNMMQDSALEATERQFIRLIGNSDRITQLRIHLFNIEGIERGSEARAHIERYYTPFEEIRAHGLDGLILTGTNVSQPDITQEPFWEPFCEVLDWAQGHVTSVLCSCLATHAVVRQIYGIERSPMGAKLWGVYPHRATMPDHPLMQSVNTRFFVPHSRYNEITRAQLEEAGAMIVAESKEAGVHMATSADGFRFVFFQGHPEYDTHSLLKEYKREVLRFTDREREDYPPFPENYFSLQSRAILDEYREKLACGEAGTPFPEVLMMERLDNSWRDTSKAIVNNWIGRVYQTTNVDLSKQFMDGIDPDDPLGLHANASAKV
ncbi:MAG: homoserine O-succinyltransferase [Alphaproteobacteria bacterium]|nr:homoserine O-succinyltransferase [Alphaproteobacteria bacterium]